MLAALCTIKKAISDLGQELNCLSSETQRHADSLASARARVVDEGTNAAARRISVKEHLSFSEYRQTAARIRL